MITLCPKCQRKLLSHSSARCNWCGHEIADPAYQQQAAIGRAAFYLEQAQHDAQELAMMEGLNGSVFMPPSNFGLLGSLLGSTMSRSRRAQAQADALVLQQITAQQIAAQEEMQRLQTLAQQPASPTFSQPVVQDAETDAEQPTPHNPEDGRFQHLEL